MYKLTFKLKEGSKLVACSNMCFYKIVLHKIFCTLQKENTIGHINAPWILVLWLPLISLLPMVSCFLVIKSNREDMHWVWVQNWWWHYCNTLFAIKEEHMHIILIKRDFKHFRIIYSDALCWSSFKKRLLNRKYQNIT